MAVDESVAKELRQLAFYQEQRHRRRWIARATGLVIVFGFLALNTVLLYVSTSTVVLNIDLARVEQSDQADLLHARLARLERHVASLEALEALADPQPGAEPVAQLAP
ncbi:MAG: hypothetical protein CMJ83_21845 [Planctomycetes bacterium]|nr:hypothetical protein [Planctomycetota bacterium]